MAYSLISIVLPIHNQVDHLESLVTNYEDSLARISVPHELILVVNNSHDRSFELAELLGERYPSVRAISSERGGWGHAVRLGLAEAKGDLLFYTNSARTTAQDLVLLLNYAIANPLTVIKAKRKIRENPRRRIGSLLYNIECRMLFDLAYWDINGTPKVFPRAFTRLTQLTQDGDLIDLEFNIHCRRENYPLLEVPIFSSHRHGGKSTTRLRSALRMYRGAYQLWQTMRGSREA